MKGHQVFGNLIPRPCFKQPSYSVSRLFRPFHPPSCLEVTGIGVLVQHETEIKNYNNEGNSNPKR